MDKVVLITGAAKGIGAATARLASQNGYKVAVNYKNSETEALSLCNEIQRDGGCAFAFQGDVANEEHIQNLFTQVEKKLGSLTALVNNAGVTGGFSTADQVRADQVMDVLTSNVFGTILCAREAILRMKHYSKQRLDCAIVNVSSTVSRTGGAGEWVHYAASKGAVDAFTKGLAKEVAHLQIRVNAVSPGLVETGLHQSNGDPGRPMRLAPSIPMQRVGQPHEIANCIAWLLSEKSGYVTGSIVEVSGGR